MDTHSHTQVERLNSAEILSLNSHVINEQTCDTVKARDLHIFLGVGRDFATWIKSRVNQYSFEEGLDFVVISRSPKRGSGNRGATKDYFITLDMAKELAMVERNEKGREARRYFINCERQLKATNSQSPTIENQTTQHPAIDPAQHSQALQTSMVTLEEQAKYRMLNNMVRSLEFKQDTLVIPAIEMINMVRAVRMYQHQIARLQSPDWVNDQIETIKAYTSRNFCD
ncbi:antA/AntB antirepressor family protein [Marinomonas sp. S3726]|uniref:antA/AntB antirepressor family protein n=1 Tax=Marinomonas sp. S3726 TaxID=579484 RepID=UPI000697D54C|nr:antA/AntB antirepressor family protein [Marinomonas sp. S3726]